MDQGMCIILGCGFGVSSLLTYWGIRLHHGISQTSRNRANETNHRGLIAACMKRGLDDINTVAYDIFAIKVFAFS